ncbi:MAG: SDR family NAD(P)-dependent oxidoreductase, partial [Gemmatimonadales bacterium]
MIGGVVVTGASSGIGAAIVSALRSSGFTVIGTVRRDDDKAALEANDVLPVVMDVTDVSSIARAKRIVDQLLDGTPLVGLVNNAGIAGAGPLELVPLDEVRRV